MPLGVPGNFFFKYKGKFNRSHRATQEVEGRLICLTKLIPLVMQKVSRRFSVEVYESKTFEIPLER